MGEAIPHKTANTRTKVLVIDDDEIAREFLVGVLRRAGFHATALASPIGATKRVIDEGISVVVLDVMMPSMSGDKLANLLRKNPQLGDLGVVLVSSSPRHELEHLVKQAQADALVIKDEVHTTLASAVAHAARRRINPG